MKKNIDKELTELCGGHITAYAAEDILTDHPFYPYVAYSVSQSEITGDYLIFCKTQTEPKNLFKVMDCLKYEIAINHTVNIEGTRYSAEMLNAYKELGSFHLVLKEIVEAS